MNQITIKLWGQGGGGGFYALGYNDRFIGGGGGFVSGTFRVKSGNIIYFFVGGASEYFAGGIGDNAYYFDPGLGFNVYRSGNGGDASAAILYDGINYYLLAMAGGGGGGGGGDTSKGGYSNGGGGGNPGTGGNPGQPGSNSFGGSPNGSSCLSVFTSFPSTSQGRGGNQVTQFGGGGGGGFGGGGGGGYNTTFGPGGGGGGGNFVNTAFIVPDTVPVNLTASGSTPAGTSDSNYISNYGVGRTNRLQGVDGLAFYSFSYNANPGMYLNSTSLFYGYEEKTVTGTIKGSTAPSAFPDTNVNLNIIRLGSLIHLRISAFSTTTLVANSSNPVYYSSDTLVFTRIPIDYWPNINSMQIINIQVNNVNVLCTIKIDNKGIITIKTNDETTFGDDSNDSNDNNSFNPPPKTISLNASIIFTYMII